MLCMFFLVGLASLMGQILLLREILVIFHGTEIAIGIFFASWLAGIGIGASVGAWQAKRAGEHAHAIFVHALVGLGISLLAQVLVVRTLPPLLGASPAELAPLSGILVAVPLATFLPSFLTGFLFPIGCRAVEGADGRFIALLYVFESLGGLLAGLGFTYFLVHWLGPLKIAAVTATVVAAGALLYGLWKGSRAALMSSVPLAVVGLFLASPLGTVVSDWSIHVRWDALHPGLKLLVSEPTPYQQVEIARLGHQTSLFGNGKIVSSFPDPYSANRLCALVMAQKPDARRVLVIGGGIGSIVSSLLQYPVERLDVVEPDRWALEIATQYMTELDAEALKDPRVHVIATDGRFFLNRSKKNEYDVIMCLVPDPVSSFWNRYYTLEFFQAAAHALSPDGVFFTRVTSSENFWGTEVASYAGSVYHTLMQVFPSVKGTPGDETLLLASPSPDLLSLDPVVLRSRYAKFAKTSFDPAAFDTILPRERTAFVATELARSPSFINRDLTPISASLAMILWGRFSGTGKLEILNTIRGGGLKVYLIPLLFFLIARICFRARYGSREGREEQFQALLAMAATGAAAMGLQVVLIYGYQSLFGYVFERVGLIAALFMAGLAGAGSMVGSYVTGIRRKSTALLIVLVLFALLCMAVTPVLDSLQGKNPENVEGIIFSLVLLSGILTGASFPLAAARHLEVSRNAGTTAGWIDAADHYGAAAGAVLTGTLLVPLLGISDACTVLTMILATPALLIVLEPVFRRAEPLAKKLLPRGRTSFPYARLSWVLAFSVAGAWTWHIVIGSPQMSPTVRFSNEILKKVSGSTIFIFSEKPYPHYTGSGGDAEGTESLATFPVAGEVRGYGGPMNLLVSVTKQGVIKGVSLVESRETPSYIKGIDAWLARFRGLSILHPLQGKVDTITGATITCRSIGEILDRTGKRIAGPVLGLPEARVAPSGGPRWQELRDVRLWLVVILLCFFVLSYRMASRPLRWACLLASLVILGLYLNAPFSSLDVASLVQGEMPAKGTLWRNALFVGVIAISVLWGQAFCGYLCPFGTLQEFLFVKKFRMRAEPRVETAGRYLKFVILAVLLILFLLSNDTVWFESCLLQHVFRGHMDWWIWALTLLMLAASLFFFRFWCRYLCPAGAFLALFNKVSLLAHWWPKPKPGHCDLGVTFPGDVDCIRCHRCLFEPQQVLQEKEPHEEPTREEAGHQESPGPSGGLLEER